jgi:small conductance mechanosensitive channel
MASDLPDLTLLAQNPRKFERYLTKTLDTTMDTITVYGLKVIGASIILIVGWILAGALQNWILRIGRRTPRIDVTIFTFLASVGRYVVLIFTVLSMLSTFGVQTTSFVAVLGAAGLAIGLALQGTLSHVASGVMLIVFRPFRVGDFVEAAGISGTVRSITLFVSEIDSVDNVRIVVPNGLIWSKDIKNFSTNGNRRVELRFQVSFHEDIEKALKLVKGVLEADGRVSRSPDPLIGVQGMMGEGVTISAAFWLKRDDVGTAPLDINKEVKAAFDRDGISIALPRLPGWPAAKPG